MEFVDQKEENFTRIILQVSSGSRSQRRCWKVFHWPTHQEVALLAKKLLQLGAKHCNLPVVSAAPLEKTTEGGKAAATR